MKKQIITAAAISAMALLLPAASFATTVNLYNGGLGQIAGNTNQFGVAICNGGAVGLTQSVPVSIAVNGGGVMESSASTIQPGQCPYVYTTYAALGMQAGQTYAVNVTIDPQKTVISNTNNEATYSVTVPTPAVAQTGSMNGTADINAQSGNIFVTFWHWLANLF